MALLRKQANADALIVRVERGPMRRLPSGLVVGGNALLHRWFGEQELRELPHMVKPGSIAVDVGAHFGAYSVALARLVGASGQVVSIEPIAEDANMLTRAARQLRLPIVVYQCALSSRRGVATLHVPDRHGDHKTALASLQDHDADEAEAREVETRTLDDILGNVGLPVSFIKIDVEGHELEVLAGSREVIARHRPVLLVEIEARFSPVPMAEVFAAITSLGYRGEFLDGNGVRRPVEQFDPATHQNLRHDARSTQYVGNFIFRPV